MSPKGHPSAQTQQTASPPNSDGTISNEEITWLRGHSSKKRLGSAPGAEFTEGQ
jgi:hypothetical protein